MRQRDRQRHQFRRIVAGKAEHQPLIAGTDVFSRRCVIVDTLRDIGTLLVDRHHHLARVGTDSHFVIGVADIADHVAHDFLIIDDRLGGDFTGNHRQAGRHHRFAGDAAVGVLGQQGVQDAVGNLVSQFVRMSHADGFTGKQIATF